jgi:hypothetical protein
MIYPVLDILFYTPNGIENKKGYIFIVFLAILYTPNWIYIFLFKKIYQNEIYMFFYLIKNISETRVKKCICIYAVECFYVNVYPNSGIKKE